MAGISVDGNHQIIAVTLSGASPTVWRAAPSQPAFSGATATVIRMSLKHSFNPLNAGWDGAARHPYLKEEGRWFGRAAI
jgi:hypothetical protein